MGYPFGYQGTDCGCGCAPAQVCGCFGTDPSAVPTTLHLTKPSGGFLPGGPTTSVLIRGTGSCSWSSSDSNHWVLTYNCASGTWALTTQHAGGTNNCAYTLVAPYSNSPSLTFTGGFPSGCVDITVTL